MGEDNVNQKLEAALRYASLGWSVIPLYSIHNGHCTCGAKEGECKPGKHPRVKWTVFQKKRATEQQIQSWFKKWPDANIGIITGAISGIIVLDVDEPKGVDTLRSRKLAVPLTVRQQTGGGGYHHVFNYPGFECRNFAGKIGHTILPNVDFRGDGGLIVLSPSHHMSGKCYEWIKSPDEEKISDSPEWLTRLIKAQSGNSDGREGKKLAHDDWSKDIPNGQRNSELTRYAGSLLSKMSVADALPMLSAWNQQHCKPPLSDGEVGIIVASVGKKEARKTPKKDSLKKVDDPSDEKLIDELNKKHFVVMLGGKCVVGNEIHNHELDRPDLTFSMPTDFKNFYSNKFTSDGLKLGKAWLEHRRRSEYQGIIFSPLKETPGHYNLWRGFAVKPTEGNCSLILDHARKNIARGNEKHYTYLIAWAADLVQNPCKRPGTSIVLRGKQGTGKGIWCSGLGSLFGSSHFIQVHHSRHLTGNFNSHLKGALLVFADESFWAGDKSAEGVLKAMVTEEYMQIEPKGKDSFQIRNYIRLMIASNNNWVVPAGLEERRFFILDVGEDNIQDREYFGKILNQMNNGGREALLYYLQNYDLSGVDLGKIPQTDALMETKIYSMSAIEQFVFHRLKEGKQTANTVEWDTANVPKSEFYSEFISFCGKKSYVPTLIEFCIAIQKLFPNLKDKRKSIGGERPRCYIFPSLEECRKYWENITNSDGYKWEDEEEEEAPF